MNRAYAFLRPLALRWLRVPHEPQAPAGSPGTLRVFRAGVNLFRLQMGLWVLRQGLVFVGLAFGLWLVHAMLSGGYPFNRWGPPGYWLSRHHDDFERWHVLRWFIVLKIIGVTTAVIGATVGYAVMRLRYELHWYMVTDRSLRIREGVTNVREMTLSFANIQQIAVRQGPIQRLLGLADVVVTTAGGGGSKTGSPGHGRAQAAPCHVGVLGSVADAESIRDLMLERLRRMRSSGLGDPDDRHDPRHREHPIGPEVGGELPANPRDVHGVLEAAREALEEARALRAACRG